MIPKKILLILFFFCCLLLQAAALSVAADKQEPLLGETIVFSGNCSGNTVNVNVLVEGKKIAEGSTGCYKRIFSISIETQQSQPSGNWNFIFSDSESESTESVFVMPRRETMLLAITIQNPSSDKLHRNETAGLIAKVIYNNNPFSDANLFYWLPDGNRVIMASAGNGIFNGTISIPGNFSEKEWSLIIVAVSSNQELRGQIKQYFAIVDAEIPITVIEPRFDRIEAGMPQNFIIEATYADGSALGNPEASISIGNENIEMQKISDTRFAFQKLFEEKDIGSKTIFFTVKDAAGNTASKEFSFFVEKGIWLEISKALVFVPIAAAAIIIVALAWFFARRSGSKKNTEKKIVSLEKQLKELQTQYFKGQAFSEEYYRKNLNKITIELENARKKIKSKDKKDINDTKK